MNQDIVIIGGGVIGSSAAYFLASTGMAGQITVIEPDPVYEFAATPKASGGIRRLFSCPENIAMSQFSLEFYLDFSSHVAEDGEAPDVYFKQQGYLFIEPPEGVLALERRHALQTSMGVEVQLLDADALGTRFPSLYTKDVGAAAFSPKDGCIDPNAALQGFRRKARSLGAIYLQDRVTGIACESGAVRKLHLQSGYTLRPSVVINAAGTWSAEICAMIGMPLPVEPMRRFDHYFDCATELEPLPFIKDPVGIGFHPEGKGYTGSLVNHAEPAGHNWEVDHSYFEEFVWPALAERVPAMERLKLRASWAGHYDRNSFDGNMILGNWPGRAENFYVAAGFSGHGMMHAPAVGRALMELILSDGYQTLDLGRMDYTRFLNERPYAEQGIK